MTSYHTLHDIIPLTRHHTTMLGAMANFMSVHATYYLGMKIGFPLTQSCIFFTALWGVFYFKEIDLAKTKAQVFFSAGILLLVAGAYLLAAYG